MALIALLLCGVVPPKRSSLMAEGFTVSLIDEPDEEEELATEDIYWMVDDEWDDDFEEAEEVFDQDWFAETVVEEGEVDPSWKEKSKGEPFRELLYEAYTTFIVEIDTLLQEQFGPPNIIVANGKPSSPSAEDAENDIMRVELRGDASFGNFEETGNTFTLRVDYYCKKPGISKLGVQFTVINNLAEIKNVSFYWEKECGSGNRLGFSITKGNEMVVQDGMVLENWASARHKEPLGSVSTTFYFKIAKNMGSQDYSDPEVKVSDETALKVSLLDDAAEGNIMTQNLYHELHVYYQCLMPLQDTEVKVTITYRLGSFHPITFSWLKSCSGGTPGGELLVSSKPNKAGDICKNGETALEWLLDEPKHMVYKNETKSTFYVHTEKSYLQYPKPLLTVQPTNILRARVVPKRDFYATIEPSDFVIEYRCLQKGTATIRVSIPFSDVHAPLEFAYKKECPKYKAKEAAGDSHYLTANKALFLFCFVTIVIGGLSAYGWLRYMKRKAREQEAIRRQQLAEEEGTY